VERTLALSDPLRDLQKKVFIMPRLLALLALPLALAGCASVIKGTDEEIYLTTQPSMDAHCQLQAGDSGFNLLHTPGHVSIDRSTQMLTVSCTTPNGHMHGELKISAVPDRSGIVGGVVVGGATAVGLAAVNPPLAGVAIAGGAIGAGATSMAFDYGDGAGAKYPHEITVPMFPVH
jgi:hypothetical protein